MESRPYDFSRHPTKEMIRYNNTIFALARDAGIYNGAGVSRAQNQRPQEARVEAVGVLATPGTRDNPAEYIPGGVYFFSRVPSLQQGNYWYGIYQEWVALGLLTKEVTYGNEYYYAVDPESWTLEYLKERYKVPGDSFMWDPGEDEE